MKLEEMLEEMLKKVREAKEEKEEYIDKEETLKKINEQFNDIGNISSYIVLAGGENGLLEMEYGKPLDLGSLLAALFCSMMESTDEDFIKSLVETSVETAIKVKHIREDK